jgi:hypothetical protein
LHHVLIRLWDDSNKEVEEQDQDYELVSNPDKPDKRDHDKPLKVILRVIWLESLDPSWISWDCNIPYGVPVCLEEQNKVAVKHWVVSVIKLNSSDPVIDHKEHDPCYKEQQENADVFETGHNEGDKLSKAFENAS